MAFSSRRIISMSGYFDNASASVVRLIYLSLTMPYIKSSVVVGAVYVLAVFAVVVVVVAVTALALVSGSTYALVASDERVIAPLRVRFSCMVECIGRVILDTFVEDCCCMVADVVAVALGLSDQTRIIQTN